MTLSKSLSNYQSTTDLICFLKPFLFSFTEPTINNIMQGQTVSSRGNAGVPDPLCMTRTPLRHSGRHTSYMMISKVTCKINILTMKVQFSNLIKEILP